jgi:RNA polymerase sigma-70 factor (ECF subfamily)
MLQQVRRIAAVQTSRELSDGELLARFAGENDEAAFTVLVERHGPLVLGVCRRALGNLQDAEDACQASFLALARKAASIRKRASVSSWLHRVASSVARNMKRERWRRQRREHELPRTGTPDPAADVSWREMLGALDEELEQLPERYRAPLILCYLEGRTRDDAAGQLAITPGTLHGRLERGRRLLGDRLTRRGVTLSAALTAAAVGQGLSQAALSPSVVIFLTKAAKLLASGQSPAGGIVSVQVLSIARQALKAMMWTQLKISAATMLCVGLSLATVGGILARAGLIPGGGSGSNPLVAAADSTEAAVNATTNELEKLQGEWRAVEAEVNGKKDRSAGVKDLRITFKGNEITIGGASGEGPGRKKKFKLDPSSSPKGMDITSLDVQEEGQTTAGIYSLDDGRLRICIPDRAKDLRKRPTELRTRNGDGLLLLVLERVQLKSRAVDPRRQAVEDAKDLQGEWRTAEYEREGKKVPSYEIRSQLEVWTFQGDEVSTKRVDGPDKEPGARFKLDPAQSPKAIDRTWSEGRLRGKTIAGIYSIEKGKLWLCTGQPSNDSNHRPTEFKTSNGDGRTLRVLERVTERPSDQAADEFGTFLREWRQTDKAFWDAYWRAKTWDERQKLMAEKKPNPRPFADRYLKIAEASPGTPAALAALCWAVCNAPETDAGRGALAILQGGVITHADLEDLKQALDSGRNLHGENPKALAPLVLARTKKALDHPRAAQLLTWVCTCSLHEGSAEPPPTFTEAADLIVSRFADRPDINWLCECLGGTGGVGPPWAIKFEKHLRILLEKNHHVRVRSTALTALASVLQESGREEEAKKIYPQIVKEYEGGSSDQAWSSILKRLVDHAKHELEGMAVRPLGGPAPAVEGEDLDGRQMTLSDFRGKVVLLSFWGSWCVPCMKFVPHERSLVERLKDRPFALVSVNADDDPAELRKALVKTPVTWRSFKNKRAGKKTITDEWRILGYPTLYLIDHQGIIRKHWIGAPPTAELDWEIDKLVEAALAEK